MKTKSQWREEIPVLKQKVHGHPVVYLDNGATTPKPASVVEATSAYYERACANIHRGVHTLSERATAAFEAVRSKVQSFLNAEKECEVIFVSGTTEAVNLVARTLGDQGPLKIGAGDEILITHMEHHSNIVPWKQLSERVGAKLVVAPITERGELDLAAFKAKLNAKTKMVSFVWASNTLGTINPAKEMIQLVREHAPQSLVMVDAAQAVAHIKIDVQDLDCDFLAMSGHKAFGPTGIGVLYGKEALLNQLPPYQGGGDMIENVSFEQITYAPLPSKFEAGTPNIAQVIGLGAALDFILEVGLDQIHTWEEELSTYGREQLLTVPGLKLIGDARVRSPVFSFTIEGIHPHDLGTFLDQKGIAVRTGHHCTQPLMTFFQVPATCRASLCFYNTKEEIDLLVKTLLEIQKFFLK